MIGIIIIIKLPFIVTVRLTLCRLRVFRYTKTCGPVRAQKHESNNACAHASEKKVVKLLKGRAVWLRGCAGEALYMELILFGERQVGEADCESFGGVDVTE